MHNYFLERRVKRLEQLIYEKTVTRGNDSRAYTIWKLLRDEGPLTRPEIRDRLGWTTPIIEMEQEGCVFKNGNRYSYNPDYNWEDVGVIPRTAQQELQQELQQAIRGGNLEVDDEVTDTQDAAADEEPASRRGRTQREPRQRAVKQNIFSKKIEEVKAAVEAGQPVDQKNSQERTPLLAALINQRWDIAKYLLDHGANPNVMTKRGDKAFLFAINPENGTVDREVVTKMLDAGVDINEPLNNRGTLSVNIVADSPSFPPDLVERLVDSYTVNMTSIQKMLRSTRTLNMSDSVKRRYINKIIDLILANRGISDWHLSNAASYMLSYEDPLFLDLLLERGIFPVSINLGFVSNRMRQHIADLLRDFPNKNYRVDSYLKLIELAKGVEQYLGLPSGELYGPLLSQEIISKMSDKEASDVIRDAIRNNDIQTLSKFKSRKLTSDEISQVINMLVGERDAPKNTIKAALQCLDASKFRRALTTATIYELLISNHNDYLVEYVLDKLDKDIISAAIIRNGYSADRIPQSVRTLLKQEYDISVDDLINNSDTHSTLVNRRMAKSSLIKALHPDVDVWVDVNRALNKYPDLLTDPDVIEAVNDPANEHSYSAGQLKRRLAELPKDVYDF